MYIIKLITLDNGTYISSKVVDYTTQTIGTALSLFEKSARNFVKEQYGIKAYETSSVIDIHSLDQVSEPIIDSVLLYRLTSDPHTIHVYQRQTVITEESGWFSTVEIVRNTFSKTHLFELEEHSCDIEENIERSIPPTVDMVAFGPAGISIPKSLTTAPMCDLIEELKNSKRFLDRFEYISGLNNNDI